MDLHRWSDRDLHRYHQLVSKALDAESFPELALTPDELRELEKFRLGIAERIDPPPPPNISEPASPREHGPARDSVDG